jgi:hypothetical protein
MTKEMTPERAAVHRLIYGDADDRFLEDLHEEYVADPRPISEQEFTLLKLREARAEIVAMNTRLDWWDEWENSLNARLAALQERSTVQAFDRVWAERDRLREALERWWSAWATTCTIYNVEDYEEFRYLRALSEPPQGDE